MKPQSEHPLFAEERKGQILELLRQIANTNKGDTDSKTAVKSSSGSSSSKGSKKVDKNSAEADKKSISGYAHMLNRHDD